MLDEQRTQGEWVSNTYTDSNVIDPCVEISCPSKSRAIAFTPCVEKEDIINAQYTALCVNNLAGIADALEKIYDECTNKECRIAITPKEALNKIS